MGREDHLAELEHLRGDPRRGLEVVDDALAEARLGCAVLAVRAAEAEAQGVPLIITWDDSEDGAADTE